MPPKPAAPSAPAFANGVSPAQDDKPAMDIVEDEHEYLIRAELPETKKEDLEVAVHSRYLTLRGARKFEQEEMSAKGHRVERAHGNFARSFRLPDDADAAKVSAEFKDGVLKVHLAKSEPANPKAIDIKVG